MNTSETNNDPLSQNTQLILDSLYCEEMYWNDVSDNEDEYNNGVDSYCFEDEEEHIFSLLSKEKKACLVGLGVVDANNKLVMEDRREALEWMIRVSSYHKFSASTLVLSVNYFDRFMFDVGFQRERPWMTQLAALACLSLAWKFEETYVPLLSQFQVECKYIFEPKTIQRMELLILSTLEWKMNAVAPFSYSGHFIRMFKLKDQLQWKISNRFESLILSIITDQRFLLYAPSVLAAAAMELTLKEAGLWNPVEHQISLIETFKLDKVKIEQCYKFIQEIASSDKIHKRKFCGSGESSPKSVLGVMFSESSNDWSSSLLQSSERDSVPKKRKTMKSHSSDYLS